MQPVLHAPTSPHTRTKTDDYGVALARMRARTHTHARRHAHAHTHFGDKQSIEKTGLDVLDLVRCKAEQKQ